MQSTLAVEKTSIEQTVQKIVADALAVEYSKVTLRSNIMDDLAAESLDFLDIVFKLERAFNIQITRGEMERAARGDMSEEAFAPSGVISDIGLVRLRELMPEAADRIKPGLHPAQILSLFTVQTFVNLIVAKQAGQTL